MMDKSILNLSSKKTFSFAGALLSIMALMWIWGYVALLNGEMYTFAKYWVQSDIEIAKQIGEIQKVRPGFFDFKESYSEGIWRGKMSLVVAAEKGKGVIKLEVRSSNAGWEIVSLEKSLQPNK